MTRIRKRVLLTSVIALAAAGAASADVTAESLPGTLWLTEDGKFVIRVQDCGDGELCGDLVWLRNAIDKETGEPKLDKHNPDPAMRERAVCGMQIINGLSQDGDSRWNGGRFYNPDDGGSYRLNMNLDEEAERIAIRGFIGIPALGKTMHLFPVTTPVDTCA